MTAPADALFELLPLLTGEDDAPVLCAHFLERLVALSGTATGSIWLSTPETAELTPVAAVGQNLVALRGLGLVPGSGPGRPQLLGRSLLCTTPDEVACCLDELSPRQAEIYRNAADTPPASLAAVAIPGGDARLGVLILETREPAPPLTSADMPWVERAAALLGVGLVNARLRRAAADAHALHAASGIQAETISFLAHEMRTPLTAIKGYATALLLPETSFDAAAERDFLQQIDRECDTLIRLIEDLLESYVLEEGAPGLDREPVRLPGLVREIVDDLTATTRIHRFVVEFPRDLPLVEADPARLAQVLRNLLENAVKYSPQGGLIVVRGERQGDRVVIRVSDQGVGIAPEHLNRLFDKFFRIKSGDNPATVGSGLGLPIARNIVTAHGGQIWAESRPGQGSTFSFSLPLTGVYGADDGDADDE